LKTTFYTLFNIQLHKFQEFFTIHVSLTSVPGTRDNIFLLFFYIWKHKGSCVVTYCVTCDCMCRPRNKKFVICVGYMIKILIHTILYYYKKKLKT